VNSVHIDVGQVNSVHISTGKVNDVHFRGERGFTSTRTGTGDFNDARFLSGLI
jgi:hypothetical protein